MKIGKYQFPDDLYYDHTHNWVRPEGDEAVQGMSDFGQALAGEIIYVEPAAVGREFEQGRPVLSVESGKWVGRINATVGGTILAFNQELDFRPDLVNEDPYGQGWMVRWRPSNAAEDLARLLRPGSPEFQEVIRAEREKYGL